MKKAGGGKIINIGSVLSYLASGTQSAYGASKAGIIQLGRTCAAAWGKDNIQVNTIVPGLHRYRDDASACSGTRCSRTSVAPHGSGSDGHD